MGLLSQFSLFQPSLVSILIVEISQRKYLSDFN